jgi:hypothetical protein
MANAAHTSPIKAAELNGSARILRHKKAVLINGSSRAVQRLNKAAGAITAQTPAMSPLTNCAVPVEAIAPTAATKIGTPTTIIGGPARSGANELNFAVRLNVAGAPLV